MANWAELAQDLITMIANRVKVIEDFVTFGAVCTSWRLAATKENFDALNLPQVPLLMLPDKGHDYQEFYSLSMEKFSLVFLPEVKGLQEFFPSKGWLCTMSYAGEMSLLHPFSRTSIQLPSLNDLLALHGQEALKNYGCLSFWRPGDLNWTKINFKNFDRVYCVVCCKGQFYALTCNVEVWVFDIAVPIVEPRLLVDQLEYIINQSIYWYLVEISDALFIVSQSVHWDWDVHVLGYYHIRTVRFNKYEVDVTKS
ncbi:hypothetical protein RND71_042948 [Anisodus tanguticus]|uniref:KIB1-4 beta-propeller domain-containing protein n=1 Tax=Anisodus tanguticus TaxID=243964 RepID=A0AAE1QSE5_9SOLA|nr:hypothetical protein RND71_042948 [Anisodus tanguticus]